MRVRKGVDYIGSFGHKKWWTRLVDDNDQKEMTIMWAYFPAYTRPGWGSVKFDITSVADMQVHNVFEVEMSCRYANVPHSFDPEANLGVGVADDIDLAVRTYLPIAEDTLASTGTETDNLRITGFETASTQGQSIEIFNRSYSARFPDNMYANDADTMRFRTSGSYKGHFSPKSMIDITKPSLMAIGCWIGEPGTKTGNVYTGGSADADISTVLSGDLSGDSLYQAMADHLAKQTDTEAVSDDLESTLTNYLHQGFRDSDADLRLQNADLYVNMYTSFPVDVYVPQGRKYISAP